jgi:dihydroorotate dehydrogenase electron transfer subunit
MDRIGDVEGIILRNDAIAPGYYQAAIRLSQPLARPRPGQFVMIKVPSAEVFLRRPFSIYSYERRVLSVVYKVVGKGTAELAATPPRTTIMVLGPLGNGFSLLEGHHPVIVAGGIGIAGIYLLWKRLKGKASLFWGCTGGGEAGLLRDMISCNPHISSMDGSVGCKGNVVELLIERMGTLPRPLQVLACGPEPMFISLHDRLSSERTPCQVLVEERMACGLGLCFGCVTKTVDENEPYKRVCKEGPVFDLWRISL